MAVNGTKDVIDHDDDYDVDKIDEATAGSETLHPGAGSSAGDIGKTELLSQVVSIMGGMGREEVNKFSEVLSQYGKNKTPGAKDNSSSNLKTIAPKGLATSAMKEDVEQMFSGQDLSEEFKGKVATLFEAAVNARVGIEVAAIEEQMEEEVEEQVSEAVAQIEEQTSLYIEHVAKKWLEENALVVEQSLKAEAALNFIETVREAMAESYIDIPEERIDVVEALEDHIAELTEALDDSMNETLQLKNVIETATKEAVFDEVSEGLAETQVEKFRTMVEDLEFEDADQYKEKIEIVKENYFSDGKTPSKTGLVQDESVARDDNNLLEEVDDGRPLTEMDRFANFIAREAKQRNYLG